MKQRLVVVAVVSVVVALLGVVVAVSGDQERDAPRAYAHVVRTRSAVRPGPDQLPTPWAVDARQLADDINRAQQVIDDPASPTADLAGAGLLEQLATGVLAGETPAARHATLTLLRPQAAATMRTNLAASAALSHLTVPKKRFPPWKIVQPPSPATLLGYFREAQSRYGVRWQYLAAIEFVETRFGRIRGPSSAGARGPMQFLPATWARYGRGNIDNQRDAILAAARYLVANGAPGDMASALYRYNNSAHYVAAVEAYAGRMRSDARAFDGYYNWQVLYTRVRRTFLLPVGYPRVRPEPVHYR
jgi:soluble lytic murein transglycosylase-like protein